MDALDEALDIAIALVGDDGIRRVVEERLGLENDVIAVDLGADFLDSLLVALEELDGVIAAHVAGHGAGKLVLDLGEGGFKFGSETDGLRDDALARRLHGSGDQVFKAIALECRYLDDRHLELLGKLLGLDGVAALLHDVHLVERDHHGHAELHELRGQVEISLEVGRVDDVNDDVGVAVDQVIARDDLLARVRG